MLIDLPVMPAGLSVTFPGGRGARATQAACRAALFAYGSKLSITVTCACTALATMSDARNPDSNAAPRRAAARNGLMRIGYATTNLRQPPCARFGRRPDCEPVIP